MHRNFLVKEVKYYDIFKVTIAQVILTLEKRPEDHTPAMIYIIAHHSHQLLSSSQKVAFARLEAQLFSLKGTLALTKSVVSKAF